MKHWLTILFVALAFKSFSQQPYTDFTAIDRQVQFIKPAPPEELSNQLTSFCNNDLEKVRAIFKWITDNIDYKTKQSKNRKNIQITDEKNDALFKSLDERVAEMVLERGYAVCDGYSRLFKTLCSYAGVRSELISGYGRVNKPSRRFGNNHTWNSVWIDSKWYLLDVTWASGYISWGNDMFIRHLDEQYFLSDPSQFILEHYPDDLTWTLMDKPPLMQEFRYSPFKQKTFSKYSITGYRPAAGIIEAGEGDTLQVELETGNEERDRTIGADPFLDINLFSTPTSVLLLPSLVAPGKVIYNYCVTSSAIDWLYIQYNNDVIMRYRLVVKKDKSSKEIAVR